MAIDLRPESEKLLVLRFHGVVAASEVAESQQAAALMLQRGKISILVLLDGFEGWQRGDTEKWGDTSFLARYDDHLTKMAIVGEEKWRESVLLFAGVGIRRSPVRYFNDEPSARAWLAE
jgi:hypothetical protein